MGLGGGGSSGGGTQTVTQKSDPWSGIQPQLLQAAADTQRLYNNGVNGGAPQYDQNAYNSALQTWQNTPDGSASGRIYGEGRRPEGSSWDQQKGQWYTQGAAGTPRGAMPTLDQFAIPGTNDPNAPSLVPKPFPGEMIAPLSDETRAAQNLTTQRALQGNSSLNSANGLLTDTLNGKYLSPDSNPYLKGMFDTAANDVTSKVNSAFGGAGRYGSGINQQVLSKQLGDTANSIYGQNYANERQAQQQGIALSPTIANQDYTNLSALATVGGQRDALGQDQLNEQINRWNAAQSAPAQNIQNYIGLLNGTGGNYGTNTQSTPYYSNGAASSLGSGLGMLGGLGGFGGGGAAAGGGSLIPFAQAFQTAIGLPWSDRRLKKDISLVGEENGYPIYHFRYLNDASNALYRGVMAQDVAKIKPDAIEVFAGYLAVDYDMIGVRSERLH